MESEGGDVEHKPDRKGEHREVNDVQLFGRGEFGDNGLDGWTDAGQEGEGDKADGGGGEDRGHGWLAQ